MDFNTERTKLIKEYRNRRIRNAIIGAAIILVLLAVLWNTASVQRFFKSSYSNFTGGLNRTVTVYDNNGDIIESWNGKIDVEENSYGNKVLFDLNGKRKAVYNAVVIVEEK